MSFLSSSYDSREPNIKKAKFMISPSRIYSLEFDNNIQMQELKLMIKKAAHLKRNFKLLSNGEEYSQYNEEIFDTLFPHQSLVEFTLEVEEGEEMFDETELLLQMNSKCSEHNDKFLLYYCFDCSTSICSECFTNGKHKNHKIQDKCFYLLPSKYLVEKIFDSWSHNPYEDYQISVDLSELKTKVNTIMFDELFRILKTIQEKCNSLIDEYNHVNRSSLGNIRDSVRDIKVSCIKFLDNLKEELNIKDIVNNEDIFVEFDLAYKELGKKQNAKFKNNLLVFQELNKQVSLLVSNFVNQINNSIKKTLNDALNQQQYNNLKYQISQKFIKPADKNDILNQISEHKKKRKTTINKTNLAKVIAAQVQNKINSDQGKSMTSIQNNININPFFVQEKESNVKINTNENANKTSNINPSSNTINFGYSNNPSDFKYTPLTENYKFGINDMVSNNVDNNAMFTKPVNNVNNISNIAGNATDNINSNSNLNYGAQIKIGNEIIGSYSSAQTKRDLMSTNIIPKIQTDTSNLFSATNNREKTSINQIDSSSSNVMANINTSNQFGINNKTNTTTQIQIPNNQQQQVYKTIETQTITTTTKTLVPNILGNIININSNSSNTTTNSNINNIGQVNKQTILSYMTNTTTSNNYGNNFKRQIIPEEVTESENEIRRPTDIRRFLNMEYILCPISQTNSIKLVTNIDTEESTVPLKFPENFGFNIFFLDCAHCFNTMNKCLYVAGGIEPNSEKKRSNTLLCVDLTKPDEYKVTKKASMNQARCGHTMIADGKYIYVVGGEDLKSVERYDIDNDIWEMLPSMISYRMYPILYIYQGHLYSFFGKCKNGSYPCSIERLNLNNNSGVAKPSWEVLTFSNHKNIDLSYYGCALHEINGLLYFFGGKCNEQTTNQIFFYNFESRFIEKEETNLLWKEYFRENKLHKIGDNYVQCSESKYFGVYMNLDEL